MLAGPGRREPGPPGRQPLTGPPRAWPVAGQTTGSKLLSQNAPGTVEPATPGTDWNSFRPPSLPAGGGRGGGVTPTVIRSQTFHGIHGPQGARRNTRGRTAAAVRASRNDSRGAVHVARGAIHGA